MSYSSANSIPASAIVNVVPGVLSAGGAALDLIGLALTTNPRAPIGSILSFPSATAVGSYFGATSKEALAANVYFAGFNNATVQPGAMLITQYPIAPVGAYLRGGVISGLSLTALQALSGTLSVTIDGTVKTSSAISLASATSFSQASQTINTALAATGITQASFTGAIAASSVNLTVSAITSGTIAPGQQLVGTGVSAGTYIVSQTSGTTGGVGVYVVSVSQTVASEAMTAATPAVTYDSVAGAFVVASGTTGATSTVTYGSGTIAAGLLLTQAAGAILSQGAIASVPATFMAAVIAQTQNWASFTTLFDPDNGSGNAQKQLFAAWVNSQNNRYAYVAWDPDSSPAASYPATASLGYILSQSNSSGTIPIYEPIDINLASFVMGYIASVDFEQTNGRTTAAFRGQTGITPNESNATAASNLIANKYNFYGNYATANQGFQFLYPGQISGPYLWIDSYINQIWLNNQLQLTLMNLLTTLRTIPYNPVGYGYIRDAIAGGASQALIAQPPQSPVAAALNNGVIQRNVPLSANQISYVNATAGFPIDQTLSTQGWYLLIQPATAQVRQARQSPTVILFYMDGGSVQSINMSSVLVQ